jgi:FKBP12-rapamycin complex-associated protein
MRVMRENKDSLMAILEAFIYDPLINWRLLSHTTHHNRTTNGQRPSFIRPSMALDTHTLQQQHPQQPQQNLPFEDFSLAKRLTKDESSRLEEESVNRGDNVVHSGALNALNRVASKLTGRDYRSRLHNQVASVPEQVDLLITEATSVENLCQAYVGWCAFW